MTTISTMVRMIRTGIAYARHPYVETKRPSALCFFRSGWASRSTLARPLSSVGSHRARSG
ncbi:Uncharacterised protein [Mycobacteroides abscessus subsp. abscessus]|nr:Uncharacterised protein [Mycobacteroides abscessus subsp. abscessus]